MTLVFLSEVSWFDHLWIHLCSFRWHDVIFTAERYSIVSTLPQTPFLFPRPFFFSFVFPKFLGAMPEALFYMGFPMGSVGKEFTCNAPDTTQVWSLGWEYSPGEGNGNPLPHSCLKNPMDVDEPQSISWQRHTAEHARAILCNTSLLSYP